MASLSSTEIVAIVVVTVLAIAVVALLLFLVQRLRKRRAELLHELKDRPELVQDRAFNRIAMARREADLLGRQGIDVSRAQELVAEAQAAFDTRSFDRAYQSAHLAHETLVRARQGGPLPSAPKALPTSPAPSLPAAPSARGTASPPPRPSDAGLAKNRAEAQFQLRILDQELAAARRTQPRAGTTLEAAALRSQSQAAFDRSDFTVAFGLALRGRRALGGSVEALAPATVSRELPRAAPLLVPAGNAPDPARTAERVAAGDRCPKCGYPALAGDTFCRGCGSPRVAMACPQCGGERQARDTFCGRCGAPFA